MIDPSILDTLSAVAAGPLISVAIENVLRKRWCWAILDGTFAVINLLFALHIL